MPLTHTHTHTEFHDTSQCYYLLCSHNYKASVATVECLRSKQLQSGAVIPHIYISPALCSCWYGGSRIALSGSSAQFPATPLGGKLRFSGRTKAPSAVSRIAFRQVIYCTFAWCGKYHSPNQYRSVGLEPYSDDFSIEHNIPPGSVTGTSSKYDDQ